MKAKTKSFKMRVRVAGLSSKNVDEFLSEAPFMQPQCSVERAKVGHLARYPEVNWNLLTMVDILNKSPTKPFTIHLHTYTFNEQIIVQQGNFQGSEGHHVH